MATVAISDAPAWPPAASALTSTSTSCLPLSRTFSATKAHRSGARNSKASDDDHAPSKNASQAIAGPSSPPARRAAMDSSQAKALALFLKSKRSVVKLRLSDIAGSTSELTGEAVPPLVRRGKIPAVGYGSAGVPCCLIGRLLFERCEVVATVVKKNVLYNTRREYLPANNASVKGKERAVDDGTYVETDEKGRLYINRTEVGKIFYDLDDESGATIACQVNPNKVYTQASIAHNRVKSETKSSEPPAEAPKSDPRLWVYRYKEPPRPARIAPSSSSKPWQPPIYAEGTLVRAICRIVVNYKSGERMLEATSIEAIDVRTRGGRYKYAEWHHAREAMRLHRQVYSNSGAIGRMIAGEILPAERSAEAAQKALRGASSPTEIVGPEMEIEADSSTASSSVIASQDSMTTSFSSSLMNATAFDNSASISAINADSTQSSSIGSGKAKKHKLPSLRRIAEQKIPVARPLFLLYLKQHFHKLHQRMLPTLTSEVPGELLGEAGRRQSMKQLKEDKCLDWLAAKCAKAEALLEAGLSGSRASDKSIIASANLESQGKRPKVRADYVELKKGKLFSWAVRELFREGVIYVHPSSSCSAATPRKARIRVCLCAQSNADASCSCPSPTVQSEVGVEHYSLITPTSLLPVLEPLVVRLTLLAAPERIDADAALAALKRKDEMFKHVGREMVEEALEML